MLESLFNRVADTKACNFNKKRFQRRHFPVNIAKLLRNTYFEEHLRTAVRIIASKFYYSFEKIDSQEMEKLKLKFSFQLPSNAGIS